jgi:BASS family bile acid:Na+ symporter
MALAGHACDREGPRMSIDVNAQQDLVPIVVFIVMLAIGIDLEAQHFKKLFREPKVPVWGSLIHTLTFPLAAFVLVSAALALDLGLSEASLIGILLIAACPSGGFSNVLVLIARANLPLSVVLTAISSLLSFFTVPLFFWLFSSLMPDLSGRVQLPVVQTLLHLLVLIVLPVGLGMAWRHRSADFVARNAARMQKYAQRMFYAVLILLLVQEWDVMRSGIVEALPWSVVLCVVTLSIGFFSARLAGLSPDDCATVAIESSIRNLAVAFLVAANVMHRMDVAVLPSVYVMAVLLVGLAFSASWRRWHRGDLLRAGVSSGR